MGGSVDSKACHFRCRQAKSRLGWLSAGGIALYLLEVLKDALVRKLISEAA
jgi:hypothetical protein